MPDVMARPLVGVTLDAEAAGGWSSFAWYALRASYFDAIAEAGGLPLAIGHNPALAEETLDAIDALVVTGGAFDVDPLLYGDRDRHATVALKTGRTNAELALMRGALARELPLLGICGGMQLLAVALGGSLIQHIPDALPSSLAHEQPNPRDQPGHRIAITPGSALHAITGRDAMEVNSSHHQAVRSAGRAIVTARAPDGIVEAIEAPDMAAGGPFCLGVQWHPEFRIDAGDRRLFEALVGAALGR